ncbi:SRPBCC family protein [Nocardioides zeae]
MVGISGAARGDGYRSRMARNERLTDATPAQVWDVLADGWLYPSWVVGATRMRAVDDTWPAAGSRLHHSVGVWPLLLDDATVVERSEPAHLLQLKARGWPMGEARVVLTLEPEGQGTRLVIEEDAIAGPGRLAPPPVRGVSIAWRNVETLRRLALLAEGRS